MNINQDYKSARTEYTGNTLTVETGAIKAEWVRTDQGLSCRRIENSETGKSWERESARLCDWDLYDPAETAVFNGIDTRIAENDFFNGDNLETTVRFTYPSLKVELEYLINAYPDAPGLRTFIRLKAQPGYDSRVLSKKGLMNTIFTFPAGNGDLRKQVAGYYNDPQNRNLFETPLIEEKIYYGDKGQCDWASMIFVEETKDPQGGISFLKESHKCVNQRGYLTGGFEWNTNRIQKSGFMMISGWGMQPTDILEERSRETWANWVLVYHDDKAETVKRFDRCRFPLRKERDMYIMSNTWGNMNPLKGEGGRKAASEESVLKELEVGERLGVDILQIDDGWQSEGDTWKCERWEPHPSKYPQGWKNVRKSAEEKNMHLGLWAAYVISDEELIENQRKGDFRSFKIDFSVLDNYDIIEKTLGNQKKLMQATDNKVCINWDVTEMPPRLGYFYGRDVGNIYLENRKPEYPESVIYKPALVLRDAWELSRYCNLNKFQISVQNCDFINRQKSNAHLYPQDYCTAITLMGSPILFMETKYLTEEAISAISKVLSLYRQHRSAMYDGYVYPIGECPTDSSWSGFQCILPDGESGYLTIFRELNNTEAKKKIELYNVPDGRLELQDLVAETSETVTVEDGKISVTMEKAPDYRYMKYRIIG
jgi:hypothetical protein